VEGAGKLIKAGSKDGAAGIGVHGLFRARVYGLTLDPYEN